MHRALLTALASSLALPLAASAALYTDTTGENHDGNAHMDISSVEVTNTLTDITFKITLNGSIPPDWGKYLIGISTANDNGDTGSPVGNPWGRNIRMNNGMDAFIGSWVNDGGGFQPWTFAGGSWTQNGQFGVTLGANSTSLTTSLASLGLTPGQTIELDVYSSGGGGGDSANDAVANPAQTVPGWQDPYTTTQGVSYTLAVPEPATLSLLTLAPLVARRRRGA
jgi:hypothetical protein